MSISQIKRRFEQFETYLGRDAQGIGKLKALKDAVNELRTSLAQSEARVAKQGELVEDLRKRVSDMARKLEAASIEEHRLRQVASNLERELRIAHSAPQLADVQESEEAGNTADEAGIKRVVKTLRRRLKHCPKPLRVSSEFATVALPGDLNDGCHKARVWDRESIAEGWSHESLWNLGASMAVLSAMFGIVVLETKRTIIGINHHNDPNSDESVYRPIIQWLSDNINVTSTTKVGFVRIENCHGTTTPILRLQ